ncbi:hypothetical protein [Estrella lausannensis]|uniref:Uncharacterized protein n=1 Tax=Estrella lausannensis TaxID=483423 RepID=A0A0H5DR78_9BACT|nr:hypothetical protein [Estrella lausannensis]CRX38159.1 hypothetical protein ELAC_0808 [Estrella lausannensis]
MFKIASISLLFLVWGSPLAGNLIISPEGKKYITLGSTQEEVLQTLGKPSCVSCSGSYWEYGNDYLKFEGGRVSKCSNPKALRFVLPNSSTSPLKL